MDVIHRLLINRRSIMRCRIRLPSGGNSTNQRGADDMRTPPGILFARGISSYPQKLSEESGSLEEATVVVLNAKDLHSKQGVQLTVLQNYATPSNNSRRQADRGKRSLIATARITYRSKKKIRFDHIPPLIIPGLRGSRRPPQCPRVPNIGLRPPPQEISDPLPAEEELDKSHLTLMCGDFEQTKADAKVSLRAFRKIGFASVKEDALSTPSRFHWSLTSQRALIRPYEPVPTRRNPIPPSTNSTTPPHPHSHPHSHPRPRPRPHPTISWTPFRIRSLLAASCFSSSLRYSSHWMEPQFRPVGDFGSSRLFCLIADLSMSQCFP